MAVLVTGGAGFIGSHLVEHLLAAGEEKVVCLDSFNDYYQVGQKEQNVTAFASDSRVELIRGDFTDAAVVTRVFQAHAIENVLHFGAYAGVRYSVDNPLPYHENNITGTFRLLEAARRFGVRKFVFASSSTVYGTGAAVPFNEDGQLGVPTSPYGATKRAGELLALTYFQRYHIPVVCLRLFSVFGSRLRPDLAMSIFAEAMLSGRPVPLFGDGSIRRDFTHVSDVCRGVLAAMRIDTATGQCINLGHDQPLAMCDMIKSLEAALGVRAVVQHLPPRGEDLQITHANLAKARRLLEYEARMPFAAGIDEFAQWYLQARRGHAGLSAHFPASVA